MSDSAATTASRNTSAPWRFSRASIPGGRLMVGCGCNTRFNPLLKARGLDIEGVDISERMVALARAADASVVVHHADICLWEPTRQYRFISAWDSIWHVPLESQRQLMAKLMSALEPGGVFLFTAGGLDAPSEHWDAHMGPSVYYATLGIPGLLDTVDKAGCVPRHFEFDQYPETHLCVIAQKVVQAASQQTADGSGEVLAVDPERRG